jgi:imidazolonepropionase
MTVADLVVVHAAELVTLGELGTRPQRGPLTDVVTIPDGAVAMAGGRVVDVGPTDDVLSRAPGITARAVVDARGHAVIPGFVDAHSHMLYAGSRIDEYWERIAGRTYAEISADGGGIHRTVRETRAATDAVLLESLIERLGVALSNGTTTAELKTGYWLTTSGEQAGLALIAEANDRQPVELIPTFLGAHAIPPDFRDDPDRFVDMVVNEMLPKISSSAHFCDVVCEAGVFTPSQARRVLVAALEHGLRAKIHADEFADIGAAAVGAELGATSADHLCFVSEASRGALARGATVAVLLPATRHYLLAPCHADARALIEAGVPVALGTDHGPSSPTLSMPFVLGLACSALRLTAAEALVAATWNAAHAVGVGGRVGRLAPGFQADLLVLEVSSYRELPYFIDRSLVRDVVKRGRVVRRCGDAPRERASRPPPAAAAGRARQRSSIAGATGAGAAAHGPEAHASERTSPGDAVPAHRGLVGDTPSR